MSDTSSDDPKSAEIFHKLGGITRQLHDALNELGYTPKIQGAVIELPDARSRLEYIARLTGEAAEKVLNLVDEAKEDQNRISSQAKDLDQRLGQVPGLCAAMPELREFTQAIVANSERNDVRLTEIMLAQDFHDLTGQVIARVVQLAATIEEQLLGLLLEAAPNGKPGQDHALELQGPVVDAEGAPTW